MSLSVLPPRDVVELDDDEDFVEELEDDVPVPAAPAPLAFQSGHRQPSPTSEKAPAAGSWWMNRPRAGFTHEAETRAPEMVKTKQATSVPGVGREFS